jgi:hypothetical protein
MAASVKQRRDMKFKTSNPLACTAFMILVFSIIAASIYGWGHNVYLLTQSNSITGMVVARVIGIFMAPLGVVLGYL